METLSKTCLICLCKSMETHSFNDILIENLKIWEILHKIVPIPLEKQDLLQPEWICANCLDTLVISYTFQKQCLNSLRKLQAETQVFKQEVKDMELEENDYIRDDEVKMEIPAGNKRNVKQPLEKLTMGYLVENKNDLEILDYPNEDKVISDTLKNYENGNDKTTLEQNPLSDEITKIESNQCTICNQIFKNPHGLALHTTKAHFKTFLFNCDKCNKGFDNEEYYTKHRNRHLGIKTFKCPQCDKAFDANCTLNQHLISHSNETPYLCTICGKSFSRSGNLKQHMLRHGSERPFKCSLCPKSFKCLPDQISHISTHNTEKRYECEICGVRLASSTSVAQHKLVHSGEKPFKCDQCDKCFNSLSNMKCHRRKHTGERPFSCQYCEKTFRQSNDRNKHTRRMHKEEISKTKSEQNEENNK